VIKLPPKVATIVVGNPLNADAALQSGGILVITGKGYGQTNLLVLDRSGSVLLQETVQVLGAPNRNLVVVYRGIERETYACGPECERSITLGDSRGYFTPRCRRAAPAPARRRPAPAEHAAICCARAGVPAPSWLAIA
jgi:hypothetical protein